MSKEEYIQLLELFNKYEDEAKSLEKSYSKCKTKQDFANLAMLKNRIVAIERIKECIYFELKVDNINDILETEKEASWKIWSGWDTNHDLRIEGATCSNCGYKHSTVYKSTNNLNKICPQCKSKMSISYL